MPITINVQDNPIHDNVGLPVSDAVIISSGETVGPVRYQIARRDIQNSVLDISTNADFSSHVNVVSATVAALKIILPFRQRFKVRVFAEGSWSEWVNFKTREKNYGLPAEITELAIDDDTDAANKGSKTITVTNNAPQSVQLTSAGATVTNSKKQFNDIESVTETSRGAIIVTKNAYV